DTRPCPHLVGVRDPLQELAPVLVLRRQRRWIALAPELVHVLLLLARTEADESLLLVLGFEQEVDFILDLARIALPERALPGHAEGSLPEGRGFAFRPRAHLDLVPAGCLGGQVQRDDLVQPARGG